MTHRFSPGLSGDVSIDLAKFDETDFRAIGHEARAGLQYSPSGARVSYHGGVTRHALLGRNSASGEIAVRLGVTFTPGAKQAHDTALHPLRDHDPIPPLVRRGLF